MTYRERIRPPREDDPIYLIQSGPRFSTSASLILVQLGIVLAIVWIFAAAIGAL